MTKKIKECNDDEFDDEVYNELNDDYTNFDEDDADIEDPYQDNMESLINDDEDNLDIIIEIDENDLDITTDLVDDVNEESNDIILSKHKVEGKHSLKYDSIFKGKKDDIIDIDDSESVGSWQKDSIELDKSSNYYFESVDNEKYIRSKLVKERVYNVLKNNTCINFLNNRRKPSRIDFNHYYSLLKLNLKNESFTNIEIFNELAVYFSDNLFNMFKLLDKKWRNIIIDELQDHIGKNPNSKEIKNRNIHKNTEIEFEWEDELNNEYLTITGIVIDVDYENSIFTVDSFENLYYVDISMITKILNNAKFKYNLNKLSNIDFL